MSLQDSVICISTHLDYGRGPLYHDFSMQFWSKKAAPVISFSLCSPFTVVVVKVMKDATAHKTVLGHTGPSNLTAILLPHQASVLLLVLLMDRSSTWVRAMEVCCPQGLGQEMIPRDNSHRSRTMHDPTSARQ